MGGTFYFDDQIYPVDEGTGLADLKATPTQFEVLNFTGYQQVYLRLTKGEEITSFHLTKIQAEQLANALHSAQSSIG